jgi:ParB family chromosome partitioning protein
LAESIRRYGVITPLTVRRAGERYILIAGERRLRASKLAGLNSVPCYIMEIDEQTSAELALVENLQRENLDPMEEAEGYKALGEEYDMTQEEIAARVGKSRPVIANALRLLQLPESVKDMLAQGLLAPSIGRLLLELPGDLPRETAAAEIVAKQMTVRQAQALIKQMKKPPKPVTVTDEVDYAAEVEKELTSQLGRRVHLTGETKGSIRLDFYSADDREELIALLRGLK